MGDGLCQATTGPPSGPVGEWASGSIGDRRVPAAEGTLWAEHEETRISVERPKFCAKGNGELRQAVGRGQPHL